MKTKHIKKVLVAFPWEPSGPAGIEQFLRSIAQRNSSSLFQFLFVPVVTDSSHIQSAQAFFPSDVQVIPVVAQRSRYAFFALRQLIAREQPALLIGANPHLTNLLIGVKWSLFSFSPVISWNHGFDAHHIPSRIHAFFATRLSAKTLVICEALQRQIVQVSLNALKDIQVIYHAFDLQLLVDFAREPVVFQGGKRHLVYVGRLSEFQKHVSLLFEVMQHLPGDVVLHLVGDGPQANLYRSMVHEMQLQDRVVFHGFQSNPFQFIAAADLLVLPSRYEGFGRVIVEALALGVNVVSTDCPVGPAEILLDGRLGWLVPVGDAVGFAEAVQSALASPVSADMLKQRAQDFSLDTISAQLNTYIESSL